MMYERFVKQFIDIMDERAPVTVVRNRMDLPLGAMEAEQSTLIHTKLDLLDEGSPYADIVVTSDNDTCRFHYIVHIPADDHVTDEQFVQRVRQTALTDSISVMQSIDGRDDNFYVITGHVDMNTSDDNQNSNSATHELSAALTMLMQAGGYDPVNVDDTRESEDLVTWSPE